MSSMEWVDSDQNIIALNSSTDRNKDSNRKKKNNLNSNSTNRMDEEPIGDPYQIIENPEQICCKIDHVRKKNCKQNPWCLHGIVNSNGGGKGSNKSSIFKSDDIDEIIDIYYLKNFENYELRNTFRDNYVTCPAGIKNLGATCYINVFLQVMFCNHITRNAIFSLLNYEENESSHAKEINYFDTDGVAVVRALQTVLYDLWMSDSKVTNTNDFILKMKLSAYTQQDPHEFQNLLLDKLKEIEQAFQATRAKQSFLPHLRNLFELSVEDSITCSLCKANQRNTQISYDLQIAANKQTSNSTINLAAAIDQYQQEEELSNENKYYCNSCMQYQSAIKHTQIITVSDVLCVQLLRFIYDKSTSSRVKTNNAVVYPHELTLYYGSSSGGTRTAEKFKLVAAIYHLGNSAHGGHYVCDALQWEEDTWLHYDDESVQRIDADIVTTQRSDVTSNDSDSVSEDDSGKGRRTKKTNSSKHNDKDVKKVVDLIDNKQKVTGTSTVRRFNRQKTVYLLYYVRKEVFDRHRTQNTITEMTVPQTVRDVTTSKNTWMRSELERLQSRVAGFRNELISRRGSILQIEEMAGPKPRPDGSNLKQRAKSSEVLFYIVSNDFLTKYLTGDLSSFEAFKPTPPNLEMEVEVEVIEMKDEVSTDIYCAHHKLSPARVGQCKVISSQAFELMVQREPHLLALLTHGSRELLTNQNYRCDLCFGDLLQSKQKFSGELDAVSELQDLLDEHIREHKSKVEFLSTQHGRIFLLEKEFVKQLRSYRSKLQRLVSEKLDNNKKSKGKNVVSNISSNQQKKSIVQHFTGSDSTEDNVVEMRLKFFKFLNINHSLICGTHDATNPKHYVDLSSVVADGENNHSSSSTTFNEAIERRAIAAVHKKAIAIDEQLFQRVVRWFGRGRVEEVSLPVHAEVLKKNSRSDGTAIGIDDILLDYLQQTVCCRECLLQSQQRLQHQEGFAQLRLNVERDEVLRGLLRFNSGERQHVIAKEICDMFRNDDASTAERGIVFVDAHWINSWRAIMTNEDQLDETGVLELRNEQLRCRDHGLFVGPENLGHTLQVLADCLGTFDIDNEEEDNEATAASIIESLQHTDINGYEGEAVELVTKTEWRRLLLFHAPNSYYNNRHTSEDADEALSDIADDSSHEGDATQRVASNSGSTTTENNVFEVNLLVEEARQLRCLPEQCLLCIKERQQLSRTRKSCYSSASMQIYKLDGDAEVTDSRYQRSLQCFLENPQHFLDIHQVSTRQKNANGNHTSGKVATVGIAGRRRSSNKALEKVNLVLSDEDDIYMVKLKICERISDLSAVKCIKIFDCAGKELRDYAKTLREYEVLRDQPLFFSEVQNSKERKKQICPKKGSSKGDEVKKQGRRNTKSKSKKKESTQDTNSENEINNIDDETLEPDEDAILLELYLQSRQSNSNKKGKNEKAFEDSFLSGSKHMSIINDTSNSNDMTVRMGTVIVEDMLKNVSDAENIPYDEDTTNHKNRKTSRSGMNYASDQIDSDANPRKRTCRTLTNISRKNDGRKNVIDIDSEDELQQVLERSKHEK